MLLEDKLTISIDGKEVECDVVFDFTCNENGRNYVAFTDHSTDEDGNENIYVKSPDEPDEADEVDETLANPSRSSSFLYPFLI